MGQIQHCNTEARARTLIRSLRLPVRGPAVSHYGTFGGYALATTS